MAVYYRRRMAKRQVSVPLGGMQIRQNFTIGSGRSYSDVVVYSGLQPWSQNIARLLEALKNYSTMAETLKVLKDKFKFCVRPTHSALSAHHFSSVRL